MHSHKEAASHHVKQNLPKQTAIPDYSKKVVDQ